jgi:hypothetical protein
MARSVSPRKSISLSIPKVFGAQANPPPAWVLGGGLGAAYRSLRGFVCSEKGGHAGVNGLREADAGVLVTDGAYIV